jgi:hypothetical protein
MKRGKGYFRYSEHTHKLLAIFFCTEGFSYSSDIRSVKRVKLK